jgi:branched-chain amino acid transport system permease protein
VSELLKFALLGLGSGAAYGAAAQGLVLIQRASGVINFAQGAIAMYGIYTYVELRHTGRLVHPLPGVPVPEFGEPLSLWPALVLALAVAALIGLLIYLLVMRPLREAPPLARLASLVGVLLTLQGLALVRFGWPGREPRLVQNILPADPIDVLGSTIPSDRVYMVALLAIVSAALAGLFRYTRFGLSTRAAAGSEKGAVLIGLRPERLAALNWMLASVIATGFGIMLAPNTPLDPSFLVFAIVPALAAALAARFKSFAVAAAVGVAIGVAQSLILKLQAEVDWLPRAGLQEGVPLLILLILVPIFGRTIVAREPLGALRTPLPPPPANVSRGLLIGCAIVLVGLATLPSNFRLALIVSMVGAVICLSLVVITGFLGQLSLAQMALAGIAGFTLSRLAVDAGIPFPLSPLLAVVAAAAVGFAVGLPSVRVRGTALAVVTLAAGVAIEQLLFRNESFTRTLRGSSIPEPSLLGLELGILTDRTQDYPSWVFGVLVLGALAVCAVAVANLRRSHTGMILVAVRSNERAAAALGIDVPRTKLLTFTLASAIAGLAGVLVGYTQTKLSVASFSVQMSLMYLAWAYLGGIASVSGALIGGCLVTGGLVYTVLEQLFDFGEYAVLVAGLALVLTAVLNPRGIVGLGADVRAALGRRSLGQARAVRAQGLPADGGLRR